MKILCLTLILFVPGYFFALHKETIPQEKLYAPCKQESESARVKIQKMNKKSLKAAKDYAKALGK